MVMTPNFSMADWPKRSGALWLFTTDASTC